MVWNCLIALTPVASRAPPPVAPHLTTASLAPCCSCCCLPVGLQGVHSLKWGADARSLLVGAADHNLRVFG